MAQVTGRRAGKVAAERRAEPMARNRIAHIWAAVGLFALAAAFCVPLGLEADSLLATADDPAAIADGKLGAVLDETVAQREIKAALSANDADMAKSLDRKSTRLNSSHIQKSRMPSSA